MDTFVLNVTRATPSCQENDGFETRSYAGFAQYFVAVGVLSFLYCLAILFVYVMFINPNLPFAKWIILFVGLQAFYVVDTTAIPPLYSPPSPSLSVHQKTLGFV